ncbi:MAG: GxxExxY protein [Flavobacteriales bacterium]|nr:GxxExxY protein [Flavobacteriales bacterium]
MEIRDPQTYAILGAAIEVHKVLGRGFLEKVYQEALALELTARSIPYEQECEIPIAYKGERLSCRYRADLICYGNVLVELKALPALSGTEMAQILNYLKASGHGRGLLINFGTERLQYERCVW